MLHMEMAIMALNQRRFFQASSVGYGCTEYLVRALGLQSIYFVMLDHMSHYPVSRHSVQSFHSRRAKNK